MTRSQLTWPMLGVLFALTLPATALSQQGQDGNQDAAQQANQQADAQANQQADAQANQQADAQANQQAEQNEAEREQSEANDDQAKQRKQLKIFELEHRSPREISDVLRRYGGETTLTGRRAGGSATAFPGIEGNSQNQQAQVLVATDEENGLLFVRGSQEKIDEIGKLIAAVDAPTGEMKKHQFRGVHLIPIHEGDVGRINTILSQLQIQSTILNMGETSVIALREGSEDEESENQLEQAEQIISKLTQDRERAEEESSGEDDGDNADASNSDNADASNGDSANN